MYKTSPKHVLFLYNMMSLPSSYRRREYLTEVTEEPGIDEAVYWSEHVLYTHTRVYTIYLNCTRVHNVPNPLHVSSSKVD
jgi:hypothetical protein